ncbi:MAG: lamin tail domain-containing protein, partial [bacterium]
MKKEGAFLYPLLVVAIFLFLGLSPEMVRAGVVINEVMNLTSDDTRLEFIELYNTGPVTIDIVNWTFNDGDDSDTIDTGGARGLSITGCINDTTSIPPGGYAVILDPDYGAGDTYSIAAGTIILTIENGNVLGGSQLAVDDLISLLDNSGNPVSTYGGYPSLPSTAGLSVERKNPDGTDVFCNWGNSSNSSPGSQNSIYNSDSASPNAFGLISPDNNTCTNVVSPTFKWQDSTDGGSGLCGYDLKIGDGLNTQTVFVDSSNTQSQPSSDLSDGVTYTWYVIAYDNGGNTAATTASQICIDTTAPDTFTLSSPADEHCTNVQLPTLTWNESGDGGCGLLRYELY